ncbi:MAG: hypothetical protein B1H06_02695 [Candidatus Cloacimonas sp. 4484_143]|nr:MAG: hypothetical protein B1H06_02695 [Candidatus Cloacimonas sp. 4484_143]
MKRILFLISLVFVVSCMLFAQDEVSAEPEGEGGPFSFGGGVGTITLNGNTYTQIRLKPELVFGKFGIGLDIDLLIDSNGDVRESDWDELNDYVNKIYYIRYGQRGDAFFGRVGGFPSYKLGHGLVMRDYTNMLRYPEYRQIGLQLGGKLPFMGMTAEAFTSNLTENDIIAGRLTIKPLSMMEIPILSNLTFGGTIAHDKNQFNGLTDDALASIRIDTDGDGIFDDEDGDPDGDGLIDPSQLVGLDDETLQSLIDNGYIDFNEDLDELDLGKDDISVFAVDYELPLVQQKLFYLSHYAEVAKIDGHGMGFIFPGFYSKFLIFTMSMEFRMFEKDFAPSYFDQLYDEQRAILNASANEVITKEELLVFRNQSKGWYGSLSSNLFNFLTLTAAYEDMYTEDPDILGNEHYRSIWGKAGLNTTVIPKLAKAEIGYYQTGFDKLEEFKTPGAIVDGKLAYSLGGSAQLVGVYQERYIDLDGDNKIKGKDETIKTVSMGVEFAF